MISRTNARGLYWSAAQQLAHATVNGATVRAGDLYASGTISGSESGTQGCLLELTRLGQKPLQLHGGAQRAFLEDGDEVSCAAGAPTVRAGPRWRWPRCGPGSEPSPAAQELPG